MRKILTDQTLLLIGRSFYFSQILGGISLTKLLQLYAAKEQLEEKAVAGTASAMKKHHELKQFQQEIDYYQDGDTLSKTTLQHALTEIQQLEVQIKELTAELNVKKDALHHYGFGAHTI